MYLFIGQDVENYLWLPVFPKKTGFTIALTVCLSCPVAFEPAGLFGSEI